MQLDAVGAAEGGARCRAAAKRLDHEMEMERQQAAHRMLLERQQADHELELQRTQMAAKIALQQRESELRFGGGSPNGGNGGGPRGNGSALG
jgi:hypothetical protein